MVNNTVIGKTKDLLRCLRGKFLIILDFRPYLFLLDPFVNAIK